MKKFAFVIVLFFLSFPFVNAVGNECIISGKIIEASIEINKFDKGYCNNNTLHLVTLGSKGIYKVSGIILPSWKDMCDTRGFPQFFEDVYVPKIGDNIEFLIYLSDNGDYSVSLKNFEYYFSASNNEYFQSFNEADKSQWDYPICSPNVTEQEETEIRLNLAKLLLADLHNRKPGSVKNILNSLEKMNFSKYGEKAVNIIEATKEFIKDLLSN